MTRVVRSGSVSMTRSWSCAASYEQADLLFTAARAVVTEGPLSEFFEAFDRELLLKGEPGKLVRFLRWLVRTTGLGRRSARSMRRTSGPGKQRVASRAGERAGEACGCLVAVHHDRRESEGRRSR
jgi:hypothetical protein